MLLLSFSRIWRIPRFYSLSSIFYPLLSRRPSVVPILHSSIRARPHAFALARLDSRAKFMNGRDKLIVPDLLALTKHNDPGVRAAALHALREIAPDEYRRLEEQGQLTRK